MKNKTKIVRMITTRASSGRLSGKHENEYENEDHIGDGGKYEIRTFNKRVLGQILTNGTNGDV